MATMSENGVPIGVRAMQAAFAAAHDQCQEGGIPLGPLRGRGHVPRASIRHGGALCKAAAASGAPSALICGSRTGGPRRVFAVALIARAAALLDVSPDILIGRSY